MNKTLLGVATIVVAAGVFVAAQQGGQRQPRRSAIDGRRQLRAEPVQLRGHAESSSQGRYGLARGDDLDGRPRRAQGRQDDRHHPDRRHRAERPWLATGKHNYVLHANCEAIARKLGNALCAPIVQVRARRRHRSADRATWRRPARSACARRRSAALLTDIAAQPPGARLQEHHLHRRQRRQPGRAERRRREAQREVGRQAAGRPHPGVLRLRQRREVHGRAAASRTTARRACTTIRSSRSTCSSTTRTRSATTSASRPARRRSTACRLPTRPRTPRWRSRSSSSAPTKTVEAINKAIANKGTLPAQPRPTAGQ